MAEIKPMLNIQLDLTKPVDEIVQVINSVLFNRQDKKKEILQELDIQIGNALAEAMMQEIKEDQVPGDGGEDGESGTRDAG